MKTFFSNIPVLIYLLFVFSCSKKEVNTIDFIDKINYKNWDEETLKSLESKCSSDVFKYYNNDSILENPIFIKETSDTINSLDKHLDYYLKHRVLFLSKLKENLSLLPSEINKIVVSEEYFGVDNLGISYTVFSNNH